MRSLLWALLTACQAPKEAPDSDAPAETAAPECASIPWFPDVDGDGWGTLEGATTACEAPLGYADLAGDCDDTDAEIRPDATESCNEIDDDCDGLRDDEDGAVAGGTTWYLDEDGDGWAGDTYTSTACEASASWMAEAEDCDDTNASVHPNAEETCNGLDDDCDGETDPIALAEANWTGSYTLNFSGGTMGYAFDITCSGTPDATVDEHGSWSLVALALDTCCEEELGECFNVGFEMLDHDGGPEAWGEVVWDGSDVGTWTGAWTSPTCDSTGSLAASAEATLYFVPFWTYVWMSGSFELWQDHS